MAIMDVIDWMLNASSEHDLASANATLEDIVERHDRGERECPLEYVI